MHLSSVYLHNIRNVESARLAPGPGINWLYGANGAGKTSVLEAIHMLGRGQSFRTARASSLIGEGCQSLQVFVHARNPEHRLGIERNATEWRGRVDGQAATKMSEFARRLPLVLIDPENHQLVEGAPARRRSFLDWGLFHVEQSYLEQWRRYARLLRQRNAALRDRAPDAVLDAVEQPMARAALAVENSRRQYTARVSGALRALEVALEFRVPVLELTYRPLADSESGYVEQWRAGRGRDREQGFTRDGPQRSDLAIRSAGRSVANRFSRGQMKLAALLLKLAQAAVGREVSDPLLLIDDPVSELDADHLNRLLEWLQAQPLQCWITAVDPAPQAQTSLFHVEQGKIRAVV